MGFRDVYDDPEKHIHNLYDQNEELNGVSEEEMDYLEKLALSAVQAKESDTKENEEIDSTQQPLDEIASEETQTLHSDISENEKKQMSSIDRVKHNRIKNRLDYYMSLASERDISQSQSFTHILAQIENMQKEISQHIDNKEWQQLMGQVDKLKETLTSQEHPKKQSSTRRNSFVDSLQYDVSQSTQAQRSSAIQNNTTHHSQKNASQNSDVERIKQYLDKFFDGEVTTTDIVKIQDMQISEQLLNQANIIPFPSVKTFLVQCHDSVLNTDLMRILYDG